ncbi:MAG: CerR family C-terminal domain-containing protein [Planctomycetales bacterium]|nr:CerR family C-terminal domain-containing protein [Planctomycetales bacterium]
MTRADSRAHILQVAGPIFAKDGYQSTTIRRICEAAGVNVAAVNYYFGDKERLYIEAVKHARDLLEERWPLPKWTESTPADERLRGLIHTFIRRLISPAQGEWQMKLILREIIEPSGAARELVQEGFAPFFNVLTELIQQLLPWEASDPQIHQIGFSVIGQCVFYAAHQQVVDLMIEEVERAEHFDADSLAEHVWRFTKSALAEYSRTDSIVNPAKADNADQLLKQEHQA